MARSLSRSTTLPLTAQSPLPLREIDPEQAAATPHHAYRYPAAEAPPALLSFETSKAIPNTPSMPATGRPTRICIIGGGPAGLATAIAVAQCGFHATVIDHRIPPIDKTCGEGLMPDSAAALERLGINLPCDAGFRFRGIRFLDAHASVEADFPTGPATGLRRTVLHDLLLQRTRELDIECLWGAKRISRNGTQVTVDGRTIASDFLIAADGQNSRIRRLCGLDKAVYERRRFGFRRHYRISPWSPYMELYWGPKCQVYVTPVSSDQVGIVAMSRNPKLRLTDALAHFPALLERLQTAEPISRESGAPSISRTLHRVCNAQSALVGDASGSVDAITGEGLCLSFKHALSLAQALHSGDLSTYQSDHRSLSRRPHLMSALLLTLDRSPALRRRAIASLARHPKMFESLLAIHVGAQPFSNLFSRQLLHFCHAFLAA